MGLRVNTNIFSLTAQRNLMIVSERLQGNFSRLASGLRIASAADDAAGLGISERLRSKISSLSVAGRNAQDGISLVQTAEGALSEVNNNLNRMRELAIQSVSETLNSDDRAILDQEFQALIAEIDRISGTTQFNGVQLLDGTQASLDIQVGTESGETITISLANTTDVAAGLNLATADVASSGSADNSLAVIDAAIQSVIEARGDFGTTQNQLDSAVRSIANARENLSAAESRIRDVDVAHETADLTRNSIMQQAAVPILSQANLQPQIALGLLQG